MYESFPLAHFSVFTGKILTLKFQIFYPSCPFQLFWQLPTPNGYMNRADSFDGVNSGRAGTCHQALPSGWFDSRQAASGKISDLIRCG